MAEATERKIALSDLVGFSVEVLHQDGKVAYPATIEKFGEHSVIVKYEQEWRHTEEVPLEKCRLPPSFRQPPQRVGDFAEVQSTRAANQAVGWWHAQVKEIKGQVYIVEYVGWEQTFTDVVDVDQIRAYSQRPSLSYGSFHEWSKTVPEPYRAACSQESNHQAFASCLGNTHVKYDAVRAKLVLISDNEDIGERAELLWDHHMSHLRQIDDLHDRNQKAMDALGITSIEEITESEDDYVERFEIGKNLTGLMLGSNGSNLRAAREIEGIVDIAFIEPTTVRIKAKDPEALRAAREMLDIQEIRYQVPSNLMGRIIGTGHSGIHELEKKTKLRSIRVEKNPVTQEEEVVCTGIRPAVEKAKMMLDFQLAHYNNFNKLLLESNELEAKLRETRRTRNESNDNREEQNTNDQLGGRTGSVRRRKGRGRGRGHQKPADSRGVGNRANTQSPGPNQTPNQGSDQATNPESNQGAGSEPSQASAVSGDGESESSAAGTRETQASEQSEYNVRWTEEDAQASDELQQEEDNESSDENITGSGYEDSGDVRKGSGRGAWRGGKRSSGRGRGMSNSNYWNRRDNYSAGFGGRGYRRSFRGGRGSYGGNPRHFESQTETEQPIVPAEPVGEKRKSIDDIQVSTAHEDVKIYEKKRLDFMKELHELDLRIARAELELIQEKKDLIQAKKDLIQEKREYAEKEHAARLAKITKN